MKSVFVLSAAIGASMVLTVSTAFADGKSVYDSSCSACHAIGIAGAPKLGDKAAWENRISKSADELYKSALEGMQGTTGVMPPKGGFLNLSDDEVKLAVDYMIDAAK